MPNGISRHAAPFTPRDLTRFWAKVSKAGADDCWIWTASFYHPAGYGQFSIGYRKIGAHRFSYEIAKGPIPDGLEILHSCDNPSCVNPAHLTAGTRTDNMQDCRAKGRMALDALARAGRARHEANRPAREARGQAVRMLRAAGMSQQAIANQLGISQQTVSNDLRSAAA